MTSINQAGMKEKSSLRVLFLEDCKADVDLSIRALISAGFQVKADIAVTEEELLAYARSAAYDVILSDYKMPQTTGMEAFEVLKTAGFDIPFILVSGALGEERAVDCLKEGIADYVLKDKIFRLPAAVQRALKVHQLRWEREQADARVRQLNRLYSVLSRSGKAIVRVREQIPLLREICQILVEPGEFKMAWAGVVHRESGLVMPVASAPTDPEFVTGLQVTVKNEPAGRGAMGTAIRERRSVISNDLITDLRMEPWWERARRCGYRSAGAFPLIVGGSAMGALAIYAGEPAFFDDENVALLNELAADVSFALERMDAEEMRRHATEELDQFFALSREMLCISSLDGHMLRVNRAWETALGLSAAELQGKGWMGFIHPDDLGTVASALSGLRVGPVDDLELRFRSKSGEYRWLVGSAAPVPGRDILFAAVRDLTERKQLEKQLREKNAALLEQNQRVQTATRMKSEFLANMSHELRSPLNGIIGFSELLCDGKLGPLAERPREFIGRIQASAMHLLSLINGILDLSKVEAGRLEFRPEPVIVSEIMVEVIGILGAIAVKKGIRIQTEIDAGANRVFTDPGKLKQILHNYLSNALKFTAPGGSIIVRLKAEGGRDFRLEVADSGPGILKEDIGRLFVEFQQLDGSRAKFHQGTGLGLALTKRLVEAQGGTVGVESEVGRGSTFFAVLPRKPVRDSSLTALAQILAIEHDPEQRSLVIDTLEAAGYRVETASTCREAFTICQAAHFDAIALDPLLPDGSGWDLMRQIRSLEKHRATPIIAVSMPQKDDTAVEDQVQGFLMKPFGSAELLEALKHAGVPTGPKSV